MTHRAGHVDETTDVTQSMDRRKYLSTLAAGAAFGTVAVGIAACTTQQPDNRETADTVTTAISPSATPGYVGQWGRITLFEPDIHTFEQADPLRPRPNELRIQIPFFNNTANVVQPGDIVGVQLLRIGCPEPKFVVAINIETVLDHPMTPAEKTTIETRNGNQNTLLRSLGYEKPWTQPPAPPVCPDPPPADWNYGPK